MLMCLACNCRTGTTVVSGSPKTATVTSSGTSDTYIGGVTGSVSVTGTGVGTVYIISANGEPQRLGGLGCSYDPHCGVP